MAVRGSGWLAIAAAAGLLCMTTSASAAASVRITMHEETLALKADPGDRADVVRVDLGASRASLRLRGDLATPLPAACTPPRADVPAPEVSCAIRGPVLLDVRTGGGDDRIALGTGPTAGRRAFARKVRFAAVDAGRGDDVIVTAAAASELRLGAGDDSVRVENRTELNEFWGGEGEDRLVGGPDPDLLHGGPADDVLIAGQGGGSVTGDGGDDVLIGGGNDEALEGRGGSDRINGGGGSDLIGGGRGRDRMLGGSGDDSLTGGFGDDLLLGGPGADLVEAGPGRRDRCGAGPGPPLPLFGCELSFEPG